jgi:hypothetical protein
VVEIADAGRRTAGSRPVSRRSPRSLAIRLARLVALALIIGLGVNHVWWSISDWHLSDMNAYWDAGLRLRSGEPLFPAVTNVTASEVYRYSPWFAWLWAPITVLPRELVNVAWSGVLVGASVAAIIPLARRRAWIGVAFFLPILIGISAIGNVHALLVASLVHTVERRSGPLWIGVAASLKLLPILLVIPYVGRRQWGRAAVALGVAAALLAPYLMYDLSNYVTSAGGGGLLWDWPPLYAAAVAAALAVAVWTARSRFGWLAASAAVVVAIPRSFVYDVTWALVGAPADEAADDEARR